MVRSLSPAKKQRFHSRTNTLFSKGHELLKLFGARVAVIVELDGEYSVYRSSRSKTWPPSMEDIVTHHNPHVKFPEHYQTLREYRTHGDLAEAEEAEETESPAGEAGSNMPPLHGSDEDSVGEHTPRSSTASTLMHMAGQPLSDYAGIIGPMTFDGFDSMAPLPSQETSIPSWPSASTIQMNGDLTQAAEEFGYEVAASRNLGSAAPQTSSYSPRPSGITKRSSRLRSVSQSPSGEQVRRVGTVPVPPRLNRRVSRGSSMKVG